MKLSLIRNLSLSVLLTCLFNSQGHAQNFAGHKPSAVTPVKQQTVSQTDTTNHFQIEKNDTSVRTFGSSQDMEEMRGSRRYAGAINSHYTLGPDDVIEVDVARHPEVGGRYMINSEGKIQLELVGDLQVSGLTKEDTKNLITKRLEKYLIKPDVVVKILEYNSKVVYIVGEVGAPGKVFMRGDTITVREALLNAGLPQLTAATDAAVLFTPSSDGHVASKKVNVYELLYKGNLRENFIMKPGDSLYLPPTLWAKVARFLNPVTQPVGQAAGAAASVGAI